MGLSHAARRNSSQHPPQRAVTLQQRNESKQEEKGPGRRRRQRLDILVTWPMCSALLPPQVKTSSQINDIIQSPIPGSASDVFSVRHNPFILVAKSLTWISRLFVPPQFRLCMVASQVRQLGVSKEEQSRCWPHSWSHPHPTPPPPGISSRILRAASKG